MPLLHRNNHCLPLSLQSRTSVQAQHPERDYPQQDGYALLMLWLELEEVEEEDDDRTSQQRFRDQQQRWR